METKTVNLRDLPVNLVRRAKAYAALRGITLKEFVVQAISAAMEKDIPLAQGSAALGSSDPNRRRNRN